MTLENKNNREDQEVGLRDQDEERWSVLTVIYDSELHDHSKQDMKHHNRLPTRCKNKTSNDNRTRNMHT